MALSPVWSEVHAFTEEVRQQLKNRGLLASEEKSYQAVHSMQWTPSLKSQAGNYRVGDVVTFHQNSGDFKKHDMAIVVEAKSKTLVVECGDGSRKDFDPKAHKGFDVGLPRDLPIASGERLMVRANFPPGRLKNGDIVTVADVKADGALTLQDGRVIPSHFRQFVYGYATTSHSAQGKTVDHGILILGERGFEAANLQQSYVSNSRFTKTQTVFTVDKQRAFESMARHEIRPLAVDTVDPTPTVKPVVKPEEAVTIPADNLRTNKIKVGLDWTPVPSKIEMSI